MDQLKTGFLFYPEVMKLEIRVQISHTPKFVALFNYVSIFLSSDLAREESVKVY